MSVQVWVDDENQPEKSQKTKHIKRIKKEQKLKKKRLVDDNFLTQKDKKKGQEWYQ